MDERDDERIERHRERGVVASRPRSAIAHRGCEPCAPVRVEHPGLAVEEYGVVAAARP